jgi:glycosyltransferase involved in cell wall biosynthesis
VKNSLIEDYSVDENKIKVLPPGIDLKKWNGRPVEPNKDNEKVRILFVGGEFRRKGGDLLVKLAKHDEFRDCEFHFATQSFEGEPAANIFIHHDLPPNSEELIALYQSADVFALPTRADLFSVAGLEAMAMRLPVVMTNVGATAEIVRDGESGYIIPINDEQALADRLLRLVKNKALRREFGQKGRKIIEENINIEKNAEVIVETLKCVSNTGK